MLENKELRHTIVAVVKLRAGCNAIRTIWSVELADTPTVIEFLCLLEYHITLGRLAVGSLSREDR